MQTKEYLAEVGEKPYQFAKRARVRYETVYALYKGERPNLTRDVIQRLVMASGGKIQVEDIL